MNITPPPIPGMPTPPPIPNKEEPATIDPRFYGNAASADKIAWGMLENEIRKYTSEDPNSVTTTPIEKKKNIIMGISAVISLIIIVLAQFFHWGLCPAIVVIAFNLLICFAFTSGLNLMSRLSDEVKNRPDEPIENIVANYSVEFCKSKRMMRTGAYVGLVGLLPAGMFAQSHIFYETAPDGKYVRYYMDGMFSNELRIVIPESVDGMVVKGIRGDAFKYTNIYSIQLPNTIDTIRGHAFEGCEHLTEINLPRNLKYIGGYAFAGCKDLAFTEFPDRITLIAGHAFEGCESLTFITLPADLDSIGGYAFSNCKMIDSLVVPDNVKRIGGGAFSGCGNLSYVKLSPKLTEINGETFQDCESLTRIEIPEGVTRIGGSAFRNCWNLTEVELPSTLQSIGSSAFRNCRSLNEIEIPRNCQDINERAFKESPTNLILTE
ncbi:MAG: leucine-rich repeat domain-containing protein [Bacteroidales bacterium]|nr:leucine-rich repeat domain-containing protein [Bacteroidales bacterium]